MKLTSELFLHYQRCNRRAFLEIYGDLSQRDPPSDYVLKLRQDSNAQHQLLLSELPYHQPQSTHTDLEAVIQNTAELMRQGVERIYRGVVSLHRGDFTLIARPDFLIKKPGQSIWGNWCYEPLDLKLGKRPKLEYQITATFHAFVLSAFQGHPPDAAWLLLRDRAPYAVNLDLMQDQMQTLLHDCLQMLRERLEPEVFIARSRCSLCQWLNHCYAIAQEQAHLSLLPGVTPSRYTYLQELDLTSVEALAAVPPKQLELLPGFGPDVAQKLLRQAQAALQNQALLAPAPHAPLTSLIETAPVEIYFDIESEPDQNLVYLHGVLVVDYQRRSETFYPFLAESAIAEEAVWQDFLALVQAYPDAPIFHFCPYEVQTVKRLGDLYRTPDSEIRQLVTRFIDLHAWVTQMVTLPVESYALKPIARWLGFEWSDTAANGAQSIYWYASWLSTGDRGFLDLILRYNEDDCRATYHVKTWLSQFLQTQSGLANLQKPPHLSVTSRQST
jgi:predicted RecB family nuclease